MLKLKRIILENNGEKVVYDYEVSSSIQKYFNLKDLYYIKYNVDVSEVPNSILVIPFLSNILPIAWFAGFDIEVEEIDKDFYEAVKLIKIEFEKQFSNYKLTGGLEAISLIKNKIEGDNTALLFSGGVDAYATYIRLYNKTPDLITILGADIEISDQSQWGNFTQFIENESLLKKNTKEYITTNVREFYTYKVELLLKDIGWWGFVQHGLSLIGSIAPLSYLNGYKNIYIASSYTEQIDIAWGSTPQIDDKISWAGVKTFHDGYELKRQDKVDLITEFSKTTKNKFNLRVCYSEKRKGFNCNNCEKCYRTILGIILNDENPNEYGFDVNENIYDKISEFISSNNHDKGVQYFWRELMEKSKNVKNIFSFDNKKSEKILFEYLKLKANKPFFYKTKSKYSNFIFRIIFITRNKFPWLQTIYRKIRY